MRVASALLLMFGIVTFLTSIFGITLYSFGNNVKGVMRSALALVASIVLMLVGLLFFALSFVLE